MSASLNQLTSEQQAELMKIRKRVIEAIGSNMDLYGISHSTGHLYGLLFFADKPMTLDEMGMEMKMSKTSMSTGVRALLDLRMVNKVWEKGSRKDLYEVEYDWHQTFTDFFAIKWRKAVESNLLVLRKAMNEIHKTLKSDDKPQEPYCSILEEDLRKMEQAVQYYLWLDRLIDVMESGDIYNLVPKE
ncbi:putative HTH-type transcriptional regulator YvaV [Paenibacillus antibioticophila]|uniref:HTH-type transcriptional regulator n=2 Tax=Paenibacillus TaxID=44249 RepID=A0A920CM64_9BACL|nr:MULTISPECIES: GbsR/MarR family transcriptional regulator [Paenibacillus]GIO39681.1 putative HTH-type transcriptional regulator YvaV [Paenibacillus antibioticophila]GIO42384.1 putative HTH-type transcriptional regulator YvaV [Paenibacillus apis]